MRINFYHLEERMVAVGYDDDMVNKCGGRVEVFSIGQDEQLIGCELDEQKHGYFIGVTWIKMKVIVWRLQFFNLFD